MNFKLKAFAAALVLAASVPAHAALDGGATGNGELFFNVYDTVTKQSFTFDLTPQAAYSAFGTFTLNDFLPANLNNAQGLATVTAGEAVPGVAGFNAVGAAEAKGLNINWSLAGNSAFASFAAANSNTATWQWNVVALDDVGGNTQKNGRRYLSTVESSVGDFNQTATNFAALGTVSNQIVSVNAAAPGVDDPSVYLPNNNFNNDFGDTWKARFVDSTSAVGASASFYYLTGNPRTAINEKFENEAKWTFDGTKLTYSTAPLAAAVPEPESYAMMLAGLGLMGFVARRRRSI